MASDSTEIDVAIQQKLATDAALKLLMPDGVYFDQAPTGKTRFVIVTLQSSLDDYVENASAFEDAVYMVKAVARTAIGIGDTSNVSTDSAAKRIHEILQDATLTIVGYVTMILQRTERIRYTEPDDNADLRWLHKGGLYQLVASPV